jgi:hypothetical protein
MAIGVAVSLFVIAVTAVMGAPLIGVAISPILLVGAYRATWWWRG